MEYYEQEMPFTNSFPVTIQVDDLNCYDRPSENIYEDKTLKIHDVLKRLVWWTFEEYYSMNWSLKK